MLQNGFCKKITIIFVRLNNNMEENNQNSINIDLSNDIAQGSYVNLSIVGHSSSEFIMDFVRLMPGMPKASVTNRLIMTPENAKRFLHTLMDNIRGYEDKFGEIKINNENTNNMPMGFGTPNAKA